MAPRAGDGVDAVVFDLGNVLIEWNRDLLYRRVIPDAGRRAIFFAEVATLEWNTELDRGLPFDQGVAELSALHPDWASEIAAYRDRWPEMLGPADLDAVAVVDELREAGVRVLGLTNWAAETFPHAERRFEFLQRLEAIVVSGREGVVKPDRKIFDLLCDRHGLDPAGVLFTDDSAPNIDGAHRAGWQAVLWTGADAFRAELEQRGLLAPR